MHRKAWNSQIPETNFAREDPLIGKGSTFERTYLDFGRTLSALECSTGLYRAP